MFKKGANFTSAMAFQFASTNLVLELGILLAVLMGWQFTLAEFTGGPIMIAILVLLFRLFLRRPLVDAARRQAERGLQERMEGHAATSGNRLVDTVLGNWQWNGIADVRSGQNFNITVNGDIANTGNFGYERPDIVGNIHAGMDASKGRTVRNRTEWFNTSAFAAPQVFTFGNGSRNLLQSQFVHIFNMGLFKQIPIHEGIYWEIRAEAYNVFNTPILGAPDSELTDSTFGQVKSTASTPRHMQIGARVHF